MGSGTAPNNAHQASGNKQAGQDVAGRLEEFRVWLARSFA